MLTLVGHSMLTQRHAEPDCPSFTDEYPTVTGTAPQSTRRLALAQ
ncbi:hypothetical protein O7623_03145 [Solwaraspora sp. WMMD791]|nr:hypothetical protein [Solwaraspora sp. WMMD791]WFE28223.1 hypothetical protein O7623_03145 [Solwaraspora sp. WMMD791]